MKIYYNNNDPDGQYPVLYPQTVDSVKPKGTYGVVSAIETDGVAPPDGLTFANKYGGGSIGDDMAAYGTIISAYNNGGFQIYIPYTNHYVSNDTTQKAIYVRSVEKTGASTENKWTPWRRIAFYDEIASVAKSNCPFPVGFSLLVGPDTNSLNYSLSLFNSEYPSTEWMDGFTTIGSTRVYLITRTK